KTECYTFARSSAFCVLDFVGPNEGEIYERCGVHCTSGVGGAVYGGSYNFDTSVRRLIQKSFHRSSGAAGIPDAFSATNRRCIHPSLTSSFDQTNVGKNCRIRRAPVLVM